MSENSEERSAIFSTNILVTNAPLRLLKRNVNIEVIKSAAKLDDISIPIETAILFSDYGPDFEDHVHSIFEGVAKNWIEAAEVIKTQLLSAGKKLELFSDPVHLVRDVAHGGRWTCRHIGTQFFVSTLTALPNLLASIQSACSKSYRSRTKSKRSHRARKKPAGP